MVSAAVGPVYGTWREAGGVHVFRVLASVAHDLWAPRELGSTAEETDPRVDSMTVARNLPADSW